MCAPSQRPRAAQTLPEMRLTPATGVKHVNPKDITLWRHVASMSLPGEAKRWGRNITLRADWEHVKLPIMLNLVRQKFANDPLRAKLLGTGEHELIEGNHWNDTFWGVCRGVGSNRLGKILMQVRAELKASAKEITK